MKQRLLGKIDFLRQEYKLGKKALDELESKQYSLRETLLRISGAIQALEELLVDWEEQSAETTLDSVDSDGAGSEESS